MIRISQLIILIVGLSSAVVLPGCESDSKPPVVEHTMLPTREVQIGANDHHANFFDCVRSRQSPRCDEAIGHRSASLGHLAMIAYRLGRSLRWDPATEHFIDDPTADRLRARAHRDPWRM